MTTFKNPFSGITDPDKLVKIYDREKKKAMKLSGNYSLFKLKKLQILLNKQQSILRNQTAERTKG